MDYNTQFINNINCSEKDYYYTVYNTSIQTLRAIQCDYKIFPGLRCDTYSVKDRNLIEGASYTDDVNVNDDELSFSLIKLVPNNISKVYGYNNKPFVSEITKNGVITDVLKFPLDIEIAVNSGSVYFFSSIGRKFINQYNDPENWYENYKTMVNECLTLYNPNCDYMLTGLYSLTKDPYRITPDQNSNVFTVLLKTWHNWVTLNKTLADASRAEIYITDNIETFRKFIYAILNPDSQYSNLYTAYEKNVLWISLGISKNNLRITDDGCRLLNGEKLYSIFLPGERYSDAKIVKNLAVFSNDKLYAYYGTNVEPVLISNIGDIPKVYIVDSNLPVKYKFSELSKGNNEIYSVAIKSKSILSYIITLISNDKIYTYRRAGNGGDVTISFFELYSVSSTEDYDESNIEKNLEDDIINNEYITPSEYYSNTMSFGEFTDGNSGYEKIGSDADTDVPSWFWSNTLKNWCIFKQYSLKNTFKLYVWNGKNSWICFEDILSHPSQYNYNINRLKFGINFSTTYKYDNIPINYKVVILKYDSKFTQYDPYSFQTLRIGKMWSNNISKNNRYPYTIGIPPVMRLASGEIGLLYSLTISGINQNHPIIYPENIRFINAICRECFGAGDDKTIMDDWKRIEKIQADSDEPSSISSMSESSLVDADEINTVKDKASALSIVFDPFKQYIETDNINTEAYVERWN